MFKRIIRNPNRQTEEAALSVKNSAPEHIRLNRTPFRMPEGSSSVEQLGSEPNCYYLPHGAFYSEGPDLNPYNETFDDQTRQVFTDQDKNTYTDEGSSVKIDNQYNSPHEQEINNDRPSTHTPTEGLKLNNMDYILFYDSEVMLTGNLNQIKSEILTQLQNGAKRELFTVLKQMKLSFDNINIE